MPERLIFIVGDFPPMTGGIARYLFQIVRHLPPSQVRVIGLPTPGSRQFDLRQPFSIQRLGLPQNWGPTSRQFKFLGPFYLQALLQGPRPDFILCGAAHHSLMLPAWLMYRLRGIPFAVFTHGLDIRRPQTRRNRELFNALLRAALIVFSNSRATADMAQRIGAGAEKIQVVWPSIEPGELTSAIPPEALRRKYGLEGKKCILTVGRLVERKGFDMVIRALPLVCEAVPAAHYLIAGTGPTEGELKALVSELGLSDRVTFAGYVPDDELAAYYRLSDVFAMVSREIPEKGDLEGFGIVYLEANLFAKPVVAGRSGGVSDAVVHEVTGLLVEPANPADIAVAITRLLKDPSLAGRLGENGKQRVLREFSGRVMADRVDERISPKGIG